MNKPLTPVEAISRRIEMENRLGGGPVLIASLELNKADAELASHVRNEPRKYYGDELVCDEWFEWHIRKIEIEMSMEDGRTKLYEALKQ